jgi:Tfp pilus assembly protein PilF
VYVTENPYVIAGLTTKSLVWAFNAGTGAHWHPLTWISHMVDCRLFGLNPIGHHLTALLLHILNTVLLLLILKRLTGSLWKSSVVAALFALHPLHVESVAWVAERKDVLSTLFWMLTMGAYLLYTERPGIKRYLAVVVLYALGLMAKPMLVTLPLVLLLLDYWPLRRLAPGEGKTGSRWLGRIAVLEKIPLLALAAGSIVMTMIAGTQGQAVALWQLIPLSWRIDNALVSTAGYIGKMLLPIRLAVFYPHPKDTLATWQIAGAALLLVGLTVLAVRVRRRHPYVLVGWLWYLVTLAPTVGIIQVGRQSMADRYTYIPLIGLFIAVVWGVWECGRVGEGEKGRAGDSKSPIPPRSHSPILFLPVIAALAICTWFQTGYWRDSRTLFEHAINVTEGNYTAHINLGQYFADHDQLDEAITHYRETIRIEPDSDLAHYDLGVALGKQGLSDEAIDEYREALRINSNYTAARVNLAAELQAQGKVDEALSEGSGVESAEMHFNIAVGLDRQRRFSESIEEYRKAIRINPDFVQAQNNLAIALFFSGDFKATWDQVHICRQRGIPLPDSFVQALSQQMPEP